jgi:hypothetical protein
MPLGYQITLKPDLPQQEKTRLFTLLKQSGFNYTNPQPNTILISHNLGAGEVAILDLAHYGQGKAVQLDG